MLNRVLEPEVMDTPSEALDYDRMDHSEVNRVFVTDLLAACPESAMAEEASLTVLDIGTGTAQIPIELARRCLPVRVMAVDLSVAMLHLGRANIEVAGLTDRIRTDRIDAKALPYQDDLFEVVMSNSIVHHIPAPEGVLRDALRVLAPGGLLFVRDLLRPADDATVEKLVDTYTVGANEHQRQLFNQSLRAALSVAEVRDMLASLGLPPEGVQQTSDRHWTISCRKSGAV